MLTIEFVKRWRIVRLDAARRTGYFENDEL
jgi:hypothetical protein